MLGFLKNVGGMVRGDEIHDIKTSKEKKEGKTTNGANT